MASPRMTQLEALMREAFRAWNEGERDPDAFEGAGLAEDFVLESALTGRTFHGREGLVQWFAEIDENFETWRTWIDEARPAGPDGLLLLGGVHLHGRGSGIELDQPVGWIINFDDADRLRRMRIFSSHEEALGAVGE